jgi:hypothetical protein
MGAASGLGLDTAVGEARLDFIAADLDVFAVQITTGADALTERRTCCVAGILVAIVDEAGVLKRLAKLRAASVLEALRQVLATIEATVRRLASTCLDALVLFGERRAGKERGRERNDHDGRRAPCASQPLSDGPCSDGPNHHDDSLISKSGGLPGCRATPASLKKWERFPLRDYVREEFPRQEQSRLSVKLNV